MKYVIKILATVKNLPLLGLPIIEKKPLMMWFVRRYTVERPVAYFRWQNFTVMLSNTVSECFRIFYVNSQLTATVIVQVWTLQQIRYRFPQPAACPGGSWGVQSKYRYLPAHHFKADSLWLNFVPVYFLCIIRNDVAPQRSAHGIMKYGKMWSVGSDTDSNWWQIRIQTKKFLIADQKYCLVTS